MATHSSILAWEIQWTEKSGGLQWSCKDSNLIEQLSMHACTHTEQRLREDEWTGTERSLVGIHVVSVPSYHDTRCPQLPTLTATLVLVWKPAEHIVNRQLQ